MHIALRLKICADFDTMKLIHFLALNAHSYRVYYNANARGSRELTLLGRMLLYALYHF